MTDTIDITVREGTAYLGTIQDTEILEKIVDGTSFKPAGVEYTTAYRRSKSAGGFDGRIKLVKHSKCPIGLLPRVINIIRDTGLNVNVVQADTAEDKSITIETRLDGLESRFYQDDAVAVTNIFDRGVIRAPTGGGKTAIIARIIHEKKKRALVIVPTIDLLYQFKEFLTEHLRVFDGLERVESHKTIVGVAQKFESIGQLGDGVVDPRGVTVATVRTMAKVLDIAYETYEYAEVDDKDDTEVNPRELREWIESIGLLTFDEVHTVAARMAYDITNAISAKNKYGTSASPWRDDGADLMIEAAIGPVLYRIDPKTLVNHGFLVPPIIQVIPTSKWWTAAAWGKICKRCGRQALKWKPTCECGSSEFKSQYQEMYKSEIVENEVRNTRIAEKVIALDAPTLMLVKQISHGRRLQELIPDSIFLSGKDKGSARKDAFDAVRSGEQNVLICSTIADMGLDLPILEVLVLAGGGKSSTRHLQRIGRVVRTYQDKKNALIIDFDDSHVSTWLGKHEQERRKIELAEWADCAIWY